MKNCPYCSRPLLRYLRSGGIYWFCLSCRQEIPHLPSEVLQPRDALFDRYRQLEKVRQGKSQDARS